MKYKQKRKASMRRQRPVRGKSGLTRPAVSVRSRSGLSYPLPGRLGRELAER
jgi:hypothetical protein